MIDNPLAGAVRLLAPAARPREPSWGVVTAVAPKVRVRLATPGEDTGTDEAVLPLVPPWALSVGQKVRVSWMGRVMLLTHRTYSGAGDLGAWRALPLSSPWARYSSSFGAPEWCRRGDVVHLSGLVSGGVGGQDAPIAVMPEGARPSTSRIIAATRNGEHAEIQVAPNGALWLRHTFPTASWLSLDNLTYRL